jgi:nucleoside-diphosphate-sugar epimerase
MEIIMKMAITGGTGFVGRHLAETLVNEGHQVVLLEPQTIFTDAQIKLGLPAPKSFGLAYCRCFARER